MLTKQETLLGRGTPVESNRVRDPRRTVLPYSLGFMVMGLVSGLSLASHSDSGPSWWLTHCSVKMDASKKDSGRLVGHVVSPFDIS